MPIFTDTFTGTAATTLSTYSATWVKHTASGSNAAEISNANRCRPTNANVEIAYYANITPPSADYSVSSDIYVAAGAAGIATGVLARVDSGANTWYLADLAGAGLTTANWRLFKRVAGTFTQLGGNVAQTTADGTAYALKLECIGSAIKVYTLGSSTAAISQTDTAITAAGFSGIRLDSAAGDASGIHIDNFDASAIGGVSFTARQGLTLNQAIKRAGYF